MAAPLAFTKGQKVLYRNTVDAMPAPGTVVEIREGIVDEQVRVELYRLAFQPV